MAVSFTPAKRIPTAVWPSTGIGSSLFWIANHGQREQPVVVVRREWKFGTINSNGGYVLGDLLLASLAPFPSTAPSSPPPAVHERRWNPFFLSIEFNGYPRRLIYWMRSFAPPARNNCNLQRHRTLRTDLLPSTRLSVRRCAITCPEIRLTNDSLGSDRSFGIETRFRSSMVVGSTTRLFDYKIHDPRCMKFGDPQIPRNRF